MDKNEEEVAMRRRDFLKRSLVLGGGAGLSVWKPHSAVAAKMKESYGLNLEKNVYSGKRYEATVPDTLDLPERAELGLNGIGGTIDPALHYQMFFSVSYAWRTPYMSHMGPDITCDPMFAESLPMLRLMSGSDRYADIEAAQRAELLSRIRDGLYWNFADPGRPWRSVFSKNPLWDRAAKDEDVANVNANARMLRTLVTWRELSDDPAWDKPIRDLVRGLQRIAIHRDNYSYYPDGGFGEAFSYPRSGWQNTDEPQTETTGTEGSVVAYHGDQIQGLMRWYALSGDPEALDLAARLTRFCMLPKFWGGLPDPDRPHVEGLNHIPQVLPSAAGVAASEMGHWYTHFHARAIAMRGMMEYGMAAPDERVLEFVRRAYEYTWTFGIPRLGWINCLPTRGDICESGCALMDMVSMGIRLSDAGVGDFWDDVDSVVRNHLVEVQLVRADLLEKVAKASPVQPPEARSQYPNQETRENVIQRSLGIFASGSSPNTIIKPGVGQCCTASGTQGLYYAWEGAVREEGDTAQINLLLNRASRSVDVDSYLPYEGKVTIQNKGARRVAVRIPLSVPRREIRSDVSGQPRAGVWVGNYLLFEDLKPGEKINIGFPMRETTARYTAAARTKDERTYTCTFRGNTLVDISPRDESPTSYPLYLRQHMRADKAPMKRTTRFVPERIIRRW